MSETEEPRYPTAKVPDFNFVPKEKLVNCTSSIMFVVKKAKEVNLTRDKPAGFSNIELDEWLKPSTFPMPIVRAEVPRSVNRVNSEA